MLAQMITILNAKVLAATVAVNCGDNTTSLTCDTGLAPIGSGTSQVHQILAIVFAVIAALAVLMIVISGLRLTIAQGNPQEIAKARNTIIYALIGLVVALSAEAIVAFVLGKS